MTIHSDHLPIRPDPKEQTAEQNKRVSIGDFRAVLERQRLACPPPASSRAAQGAAVGDPAQLQQVEAVTAASRVQGESVPDVTGFLELVHKTEPLLRGVTLPDSEPGQTVGQLSEQFLQQLRAEYDTDDLPPGRQRDLFQALTTEGVLTGSDVRDTQYTVAPAADGIMARLTGQPQFQPVEEVPENRPKERLSRMIENEQFTCRFVQETYGQRCHSLQELAQSHKRVLETLRQI